MNAPITVNGVLLRTLCLRDWCELTQRWLSTRQQEHEQALRRSGATPVEVAKSAQDYAERKSAYGLLLEMCKTYDGASMILERAAQRGGVLPDALYEALDGMDPDAVAVLAMRCCGWQLKAGDSEGNA
jgi:hypothetical protein